MSTCTAKSDDPAFNIAKQATHQALCVSYGKIFERTTEAKFVCTMSLVHDELALMEGSSSWTHRCFTTETKGKYCLTWRMVIKIERERVKVELSLLHPLDTALRVRAQIIVTEPTNGSRDQELDRTLFDEAYHRDSIEPPSHDSSYEHRGVLPDYCTAKIIVLHAETAPQLPSKLTSRIKTLFTYGTLSDVVCNVQNSKFKAHKLVLAAKSDVFVGMFEHDMLENSSNVVNIDDIEPEVFQKLLEFMYTEELPEMTFDNWSKLIVAADKYQVDDLKRLCQEGLMRTYSEGTAVRLLVLTDLLDLWEIREPVLDFIIKKKEVIANTPDYQDMIKSHPHLLDALFRRVQPRLMLAQRPSL
ncbi:speckle-type POZ protein-like [Trichogramma pretiosum]|uniref:speckle-type POZ protein-like n=1 Tax=Trichogramma pretiosum TaxID=7493 RepID=UPI0006C9677A|nr:speckle-type POZ protein-like [Trichogramma pretiosum]